MSMIIKNPRLASTAKEWTEVKRPERTRKIPIKDNIKVMIASRIVHILKSFFLCKILTQ